MQFTLVGNQQEVVQPLVHILFLRMLLTSKRGIYFNRLQE